MMNFLATMWAEASGFDDSFFWGNARVPDGSMESQENLIRSKKI